LNGVHHGRLAVEQAYGYMVHDKVVYGMISTYNAFIFLRRKSPGILYMSRLIPINCTTPAIMKLLYYFSHLCTTDTVPCPETNNEGITISLTKAPKDTSAAPRIPNPSLDVTTARVLPPGSREYTVENPRRSPRRKSSDSRTVDGTTWTEEVYLGCKGWKGNLSTGETVFAKLWDGWKVSSDDCRHEALVYIHLKDLWDKIIPTFLGFGNWGFCHILLLSYISDVCCRFNRVNYQALMLDQVKFKSVIARNVVNAFKEIHARGVLHGDVRVENILVRNDNSVIVVDFESSEMNVDQGALDAEQEGVRSLLEWWKDEQ
jgi:hypothetical protein